ncbi:MAG TPA: pseudouridine synthase [Candidatus Eisenbacteria bacterium]|nr:pseudouridine synthase [Candidatus Eisenbacteria bacterium]
MPPKPPKNEAPHPHAPGTERLQVVLARHGIASRRGVVELITAGKVTVNGKPVLEKGFRVDPSKDRVAVEGRELETSIPRRKHYFMLHKPKGVMTTMQDPNAESTVADFFKDVPARLFPVGRLDRDTTGLLIMTDDGELAFRLTHPKFGVKKKYRARVEGVVTDREKDQLERGVALEEGMTAPCEIQFESRKPKFTVLYVILHEGKKRQIRRIFEKIGHWVTDLERLEYGPLTLGDLPQGRRRELTSQEVAALEEVTGIRKKIKPKVVRMPKTHAEKRASKVVEGPASSRPAAAAPAKSMNPANPAKLSKSPKTVKPAAPRAAKQENPGGE